MIPSAPPAIIFVNNDISNAVKQTLIRQLYINDTITDTEFNARVVEDPNYPLEIHNNDLRVLVLIDFRSQINRNLADLVIYVKYNLAAVEQNKFGPPSKTLPIDRLYYTALTKIPNLVLKTDKDDVDDNLIDDGDNDNDEIIPNDSGDF